MQANKRAKSTYHATWCGKNATTSVAQKQHKIKCDINATPRKAIKNPALHNQVEAGLG